MKAKQVLGAFGLTLFTALLAVIIYAKFLQPEVNYIEVESKPAVRQISIPGEYYSQEMDFTGAAESTVHAVVHVKTMSYIKQRVNPVYEYFFGPGIAKRPVLSFGSGVIISEDGYIVTNNHVVQGSEEIEVTMNDRRTFQAKLIGKDPLTDLALLKIKEKDLPILEYGNSDILKLGEWVLAVGNPYNLTSTVTAGIVSAKARNISILRDSLSIESFIQTDAAVNPGNSGGALVNTSGQLVGINTAIASRTGNYTGYSFAIPVSIVRKVVADLREFGEVQRAILGVTIKDVTAELAEKEKLENTKGVFISDLTKNGAAKEAGIEIGDVILSINDISVNSVTELQEQVSKFRPNDKVKVLLKRKGELKQFDVVLRNMQGNTEIVRSDELIEVLGATFEALSSSEKSSLGIQTGVRVLGLKSGKLSKVGIKKGFVITAVNKIGVNSVKDILDILQEVEEGGGVIIEGIYDDGSKGIYAIGM